MDAADKVHKAFQAKLAILRSEKENMGDLHPFLGYQLTILEALDANYDDLADMENMKLALLELLKIFEPIII